MSFDHDKSSRQQRMVVCTPQDTETEGEKQFKRLLDKQLKKDITLRELSQQKRTFNKSSFYNPLTDDVAGQVQLDKYQQIEEEKSYVEKLQQIGLSQYEINLWIKHKNGRDSGGHRTVATDPQILQRQLEEIEDKIRIKNEEIEKIVQTRDVLCLSRHEMEIESSLKRTNKRTQFLNKLVKVGHHSANDLRPNDPRNHLKEMERDLLEKIRTKRKTNETTKSEEQQNTISSCARRPISDDEISNNRLSLADIRSLPKFTHYDSGETNAILYVKNLSRQTIADDLKEIFSRFGTSDVRILTGKMHGQAFITFTDTKSAENALETVNGFILHGKPLIIYFKK